MERKAAPAAGGLDHQFAGTQVQLAANQVHLPELGVFKPVRWLVEVGAGVLHLLVEPEFVEVVRQVIVRGDVPARIERRIAPAQEAQEVAGALKPRALQDPLARRKAQQGDLLEIALHVDVAPDIGLAETHRRPDHPPTPPPRPPPPPPSPTPPSPS